jgi:hypothetical protein
MTIARAVRRRLLGLLPDPREDSNASLKVTLRNILDQFGTQVVGGIENLIEHGLGTALEMDGLATPVGGGTAALDPTVILETIEQAGKGWTLDTHALGDFFLGKVVSTLGKVNERAPLALAQPKRPQALVELRPPGACSAEEYESELVDIWTRHVREIG